MNDETKCPKCGANVIFVTTGNAGGLLEAYCEADCGWEETGVVRAVRLANELTKANASLDMAIDALEQAEMYIKGDEITHGRQFGTGNAIRIVLRTLTKNKEK